MATRYTQPQSGPARINWANQLLRGADPAHTAIWTPNTQIFTGGVAPSNVVAPVGIAGSFNGSSQYGTLASAGDGAAGTTMFLWVRGRSAITNASIKQALSRVNSTGSSLLTFGWDHVAASFSKAWAINDGGGWHPVSYPSLLPNVWYLLSATHSPVAGLRIYQNGVFVSNDASATGFIGGITSKLFIGSGSSDGVSGGSFADVDIAYAGEVGRSWSDAEHALFAATPWKLFATPSLPIWVAASGGGGVSLTGQSTAVAQGSITLTSSVPLTGQSVTSAQGTLSPTLSAALTGQSTAAAQGSVGPSITVALTGQSTSLAQGTVSVATQNITLALTGQSVTTAQGTLSPATSVPVTGQPVTTAQGAVASTTSVALTGQSVALAQGSVTPATTIGLTGQSVSVGQGIMAVYGADVTVALTGQSITVQQGLMTVAVAASASKSGVSRQWLIDYYTEAFAKKDKLPDEQAIAKLKTAAARKKAIRIAEIVQEEAIEKLVAKAESDLQVLTQGIKDSQAAQEFTYNLISQAKKHIASEVDFIAVAEQYQNRIRQEDDELLLLSMIL